MWLSVSMPTEAKKVFKNQIGFTTFSLKRENSGMFSLIYRSAKLFNVSAGKGGFNLFAEGVEVDVWCVDEADAESSGLI